MRDPKRIPKFLDVFKQIWKMHPDLRFSQLILNCAKPDKNDPSKMEDLYYIEDEELLQRIISTYSNKEDIDNFLDKF